MINLRQIPLFSGKRDDYTAQRRAGAFYKPDYLHERLPLESPSRQTLFHSKQKFSGVPSLDLQMAQRMSNAIFLFLSLSLLIDSETGFLRKNDHRATSGTPPNTQGFLISTGRDHYRQPQASELKDYQRMESRYTEVEPRIIITPVMDERDRSSPRSYTSKAPTMARSSPFSPRKVGLGQHVSMFLKRRVTGFGSSLFEQESQNHLDDPLGRKILYPSKFRSTRGDAKRLLSIIAKQAVIEKKDEQKIFHTALVNIAQYTNAYKLGKSES